jgi:sporulation protein YlmC with PRC-barrel domain
MEIPLNAQVEYSDGVCWHAAGHSEYVLIDPVLDQITHLVVKEDSSPNKEYIVPVESVAETKGDTIRLLCNKAELEKMDPFVETEFVGEKVPTNNLVFRGGTYGTGSYYYLPYVTSEKTVQVPVKHRQIPLGELAVRRGTRVEAQDGYVGKVDEFVISRQDGHITHLVMREGHLWGKRDVIIPVAEMGETREDTVFLKLDKQQVEALPAFPLHRPWS